MPERTFKRFVLEIEIEVNASGAPLRAWAYDFAGDGCALELPDACPLDGDQIVVVFDARNRVPGRLLWRTRRNGCVRFLDRISEAMVDELDRRAVADHIERTGPRPRLAPRRRPRPRQRAAAAG